MKKIASLILAVLFIYTTQAQDRLAEGALMKSELPKVYINSDISLHFVSPEPITYVDISTNTVMGDIPVDNILRIKPIKDSLETDDFFGFTERSIGIVTIVGEKYIAQYDVWYVNDSRSLQTQIEILPANTNPLKIGDSPLSQNQLRDFSLSALGRKPKLHIVRSTAYGITTQVNNIYAIDDYIFLDLGFDNRTNLKYDIDQLTFKIEDKRITKATNVQAIELQPVFVLNKQASFNKRHRNIYVLKKFTFPDNKILTIELAEAQISGRVVRVQLDYSDLLNADTL